MSRLLTRGDKENVPGIPSACATHNLAYLVRGLWPEVKGLLILAVYVASLTGGDGKGAIILQPSTALIASFMGPMWGPPGADKTQVGPMLATWTLLYWLVISLDVINNILNPAVWKHCGFVSNHIIKYLMCSIYLSLLPWWKYHPRFSQ